MGQGQRPLDIEPPRAQGQGKRMDALMARTWSRSGTRSGAPAEGPSLRLVIALIFGILTLAALVTLSLVLGHTSQLALEAEIGRRLGQTVDQTARQLDRGMFARWRDVQTAASLTVLRDGTAPAEVKREILETLRGAFPDYAWIGLVGTEGRVEVATDRLLEGTDVAGEPWFREGRRRPMVGDVHDSALLAGLLPRGRSEEPSGFIDLAGPVIREDGRPVAVLAAQLRWRWVDELRRSATESVDRQAATELLVVSAAGTVLSGPRAMLGATLASEASIDAPRVETWEDGISYLTAVAVTQGYASFPGLGWRVVARTPVAAAYAPVHALERRLIAGAAVAAVLLAALGWLAASWVARPLDELTFAAMRLLRRRGQGDTLLPLPGRYREVALLSRSMAELLAANETSKAQLEAALADKTALLKEVHHRVKNNLQVIVSLLRMDLQRAGNAEAADRFRRAIQRVNAMSLAHTQIYSADNLAHVDLARQVRGLVEGLGRLERGSDGREIKIEVEAEALYYDVETAIPIGLILNELVTNSLRHAFPGRVTGRVTIALQATGEGGARLEVTDDGIGGDLEQGGRSGIGRSLVAGLARQINAGLREESGDWGRRIILDVPPRLGPASAA